jgi:hypothetical protein
MHVIEASFNRINAEYPNHSTYINYVRTIKERGYEKGLVLRFFRKLVDRDDYQGVHADKLIPHLVKMCRGTPQKPLIPSPLEIGTLRKKGTKVKTR